MNPATGPQASPLAHLEEQEEPLRCAFRIFFSFTLRGSHIVVMTLLIQEVEKRDYILLAC